MSITDEELGRQLFDCWQDAVRPLAATGEEILWDDYDPEQQYIWRCAAERFASQLRAQAAWRPDREEIASIIKKCWLDLSMTPLQTADAILSLPNSRKDGEP